MIATFEQEAYVKASDTAANQLFGRVALAGDGMTFAVGALNKAYVYIFSGGVWQQQALLVGSNTEGHDQFGSAVALSSDGNTLAVGAAGEDSSATGVGGDQTNNSVIFSGAVYVFTRNAGNWAQQAYIKASNTGAWDSFGGQLALSADGNTLAVGAIGEDSDETGIGGTGGNDLASSSGAVYVYTRSGGSWAHQAYIKASNTDANDNFGVSVSLSSSGDKLVVGAFGEGNAGTLFSTQESDNSASGSGAAYVFTRSAGTWSQQEYVKASNTGAVDWFGMSVAISGDGNTLAVGAVREDSNALDVNGAQSDNSAADSGAVYIYTWSGSAWSYQAYLKASNTDAGDNFGNRLSLSSDGNVLAVSAPQEDSNATGVNGDRSNNSSADSGAAYTFTRSGGTWKRGDYVKASNTGAGDRLAALALSSNGNTLAAGAGREDSNATGINGNQSNNSATDSGAAYIYTR